MARRATAAVSLFALAFAGVAHAAPELVDAVKAEDHETAMELARKRGTDVNEPSADGSTALLWAAHHEDAELVRTLLREGADANAANDYGVTPMQEAAKVGDAPIVKMLLDAGADPESPNSEGQTALMAVARTGDLEAARALLEAGANPNATEQWGGQTALMWAAAQHQPEMIALLLEHGADPNMTATARDWGRRVTSEPRIKEMWSGGLTALIYAAREGCAACVPVLIEGGADPDLGDPDGVTPLISALLNMRFDAAKALIENGADPNKWDFWGRTPLYAVADTNIVPVGARPDLPSLDRTTGIEVARMLLEAGADPNLRLKQVPPPRNIVYDRGQDDGTLTTGTTPLVRAAYGGDLEMMELLLAQPGVLTDLPNMNGVTALAAASSDGGTRGRDKTEAKTQAAIRLMVEAGADVNQRGRGGVTPLHQAVRQNAQDVVRLLVEHGADLEAEDSRGLTPLDYAMGEADSVAFGNYDVVGELPEMAALLRELMGEAPEAAEAPAEEDQAMAGDADEA